MELIFRGINFREFAIFGKFAESIFANFEKSAKPFFVIYLLFLPILQYFWKIDDGIYFRGINFRELVIFNEFRGINFRKFEAQNSRKLIPRKLIPSKW